MPNLNIDRIINGTFHKRLSTAYESMRETGLTKDSAKAYAKIYMEASLSDIMEESELIFKEPMIGLPFFVKIMTESYIPLHNFSLEKEKIVDFFESNRERMSDEQSALYEKAIAMIENFENSRAHEINLACCNLTESTREIVESFCDNIFNAKSIDELDSTFNSFMESAPIEQKYAYLMYTSELFGEGTMTRILKNDLVITEAVESDPELYTKAVKANVFTTYLLEDSALDTLKNTRNFNCSLLITEAATENYGNVINELFTERVTGYDPAFTSGEDMIERVLEDDSFYETTKSLTDSILLMNLYKAKIITEAVTDLVSAENERFSDNVVIESPTILNVVTTESNDADSILEKLFTVTQEYADKIEGLTEKEDNSFFEFTRRGEMPESLKAEIGSPRENDLTSKSPSEGKKKVTKKTDSHNSYSDDDDEDDVDDDVDDDDDKHPVPKKPVKPKQSLADKVQTGAMDTDMKIQKASAAAEEKLTGVKNAVKAIVRIPAQFIEKIKNKVAEFDAMDEEKKKKAILNPGYRNSIFKLFKTALKYGISYQVHFLLPVVLYIYDHSATGKAKAARIRNQLIMELDAEIDIVKEKIKDAENANDNDSKYQLMRIQKKLEGERIRVIANSKTI